MKQMKRKFLAIFLMTAMLLSLLVPFMGLNVSAAIVGVVPKDKFGDLALKYDFKNGIDGFIPGNTWGGGAGPLIDSPPVWVYGWGDDGNAPVPPHRDLDPAVDFNGPVAHPNPKNIEWYNGSYTVLLTDEVRNVTMMQINAKYIKGWAAVGLKFPVADTDLIRTMDTVEYCLLVPRTDLNASGFVSYIPGLKASNNRCSGGCNKCHPHAGKYPVNFIVKSMIFKRIYMRIMISKSCYI